jgi:uncharacterized zinc-type alcohol dehydrogenase-like protein
MTNVRAWVARESGDTLTPFEFQLGTLEASEVEIAVEHCGLCYSDLAAMNSEWGPSSYPIVPGHEVIGRVSALGSAALGLRVGQRVGLGWWAESCSHCAPCVRGEQNFCVTRKPTIVGRYGGFASHVRAHWSWCIPLPEALDPALSGPLMCGGITVFSPFLLHDIKPVHRVGVVGIGGLGHMAVRFARAWGCEVTAFTSKAEKCEEALRLGAHRALVHTDANALKAMTQSLDFLLVTVRKPVDWSGLINTLAPDGRMHLVGVPNEAVPIDVRPHLIMWRRTVSGSSTGSPSLLTTLLSFAARHQLAPEVERFPMARINEAIQHLRSGKARYRVVLDADFS